MDPATAVSRVFDALLSGELRSDDLSARKITAFLGHSTIVLYHHFGSLDGFLIRVDGLGWKLLVETLQKVHTSGGSLGDLAAAYVDFGLTFPHLYGLMGHHRFDRELLQKQRRLSLEQPLLKAFVDMICQHGAQDPLKDTYVLFGGLHGLVDLALSGRGNLGETGGTARQLATSAARHLAARVVPPQRLTGRTKIQTRGA